MVSKETYRAELRSAARNLADRGLHSAAKWAAELLVSLDPDPSFSASSATSLSSLSSRTFILASSSSLSISAAYGRPSDGSSLRRRHRSGGSAVEAAAATPTDGMSYVSTPMPLEDGSEGDADVYLLAKTYFDCREYRRAAHVLGKQTGRKAVFLRCYALYLAGEKRKEEEMIEIEGSFGRTEALNSELASLEKELSSLRKSSAIDSFGLYLYGIILRDRGRENLAITVLVESVNSFPWNWNAWLELQSLCTTTETLNKLNLKNHWMKDFFLASAYEELKAHDEALKLYECLQAVFRRSNHIQAQIATALYGLRELDEAEVVFEEILRNDPYRVNTMDVYSNLLYAKECFTALSFLAHKIFLIDKYQPESCCIIANYYSLKGQHEKAVLYFRRALKLNRKYLSAWTLMGHEYVEMKNTPAAVDAYRRAVDINPRDYRAWYGLGQTYEMMSMPFYALYYFKRASFLQPNDARLWVAMAQCYQSAPLQMLEDAIKCYTKAVNCNEREGIALHQLAKLHSNLGHSEKAAYFYKKDLEMMDAEERQGPNMIEALLFLTKYLKAEKKFEEAEIYCTRLLDYSGPEKETAMSLLRGLRIAQSGPPSSSGLEQFITP